MQHSFKINVFLERFISLLNNNTMKRISFLRIAFIALIFIGLAAFMTPFESTGKDFPVEKFSKVSISIKSKVYIEQGKDYKLDIQADDKTLEKIEVEYKSDELQIKCSHPCKIDEPVTIYITTPVLHAISLAGSGDVVIEKTFTTEKMDLSLAGSGIMDLKDLKSDALKASIAGSGNIAVAGGKDAGSLDVSIAGSGKLNAGDYAVSKGKVEIAGSGDCVVNVSETLVVSIAGSGNVSYKGKPVLKSETAGSGKVKPFENE